MKNSEKHTRMANAIRALAMDSVQAANSGHPGLPMGAADIATVLFTKFMKFDPVNSKWADRDRFVLSAGHGSMLIYSLLHLCGDAQVTLDQIKADPRLAEMVLVKNSRLSVQPVSENEWRLICELGGVAD